MRHGTTLNHPGEASLLFEHPSDRGIVCLGQCDKVSHEISA